MIKKSDLDFNFLPELLEADDIFGADKIASLNLDFGSSVLPTPKEQNLPEQKQQFPEDNLDSFDERNRTTELLAHLNMAGNDFVRGATGFDAKNDMAESMLKQVSEREKNSLAKRKLVNDYLKLKYLRDSLQAKAGVAQQNQMLAEKRIDQKDRSLDQGDLRIANSANKQYRDAQAKAEKSSSMSNPDKKWLSEWQAENKAKAQGFIDQLESFYEKIKNNPDLSDKPGYAIVNSPNSGALAKGLKATRYKDQSYAENHLLGVVLPGLKQAFGGNISDKEPPLFQGTFYNPVFSQQQNLELLRSKIEQARSVFKDGLKKESSLQQTIPRQGGSVGESKKITLPNGWMMEELP